MIFASPGDTSGGRNLVSAIHRGCLELPGVPDRVQDYVGDVVVGEGVLDFAGLTAGGHDTGAAQNAQMLRDQRLADAEGGHQFVDPPAAGRQLPHDTQPDRRGKRLEQLAGRHEGLISWKRRCHMQKLAYYDHVAAFPDGKP